MNGRNVIAAAFREVLPDLPELADIRLANAIVESVDVLVFDALRQALSLVPLEQRVDAAEALAGHLVAALGNAAAPPSEEHPDDPAPDAGRPKRGATRATADARVAAAWGAAQPPVGEHPVLAPGSSQIEPQRFRRTGTLVYLLEPTQGSRGKLTMRNRVTAWVEAQDPEEAVATAARFRRSAEVEDAARALICALCERRSHLAEAGALLAALNYNPVE